MFKKKRELIFEAKMEGDIAIIEIGGRLDSSNIIGFNEKFEDIVDNKTRKVIIDLEQLAYVSSVWLGEFMNFAREIDKHNGILILINMDKKIYEIFDVVGFTDNFIILDSLEKAKAKIEESQISA